MSTEQTVLEVHSATVRFPGQLALDNVDFRLYPGEVHSLMGENGAGKSTLIKAITGALSLDKGEIVLAGQKRTFRGPSDAAEAGIVAVYQEIELLPNLSVAENIMLGHEPRRLSTIDWKATRDAAANALANVGLDIDPRSILGDLSPAVQQLVAIARAVRSGPRVLILDEPTSSLDQDEVNDLFRVIRNLRSAGVAIVFISHFLEQVYEVADRLTVLRNGRLVGEFRSSEILRIDLVKKMIGRDLASLHEIASRERDDPAAAERVVLGATGLSRDRSIAPFDLAVHEGEIVGFAGLLGAGRTEVARMLTGIDHIDDGVLSVDGRNVRFTSPHRAIAHRIVYSSEDRKNEGIVPELSVRENIVLAIQAQRGWFRRMPLERQRELAASWIDALHITPTDPEVEAGRLSGGNQQKVLLARWLAVSPRMIVLDEPTRGIDVGAKVEIQRLIASLAENGMSVVFVSAEIDEVLRLSDRIAVMREHELVTVLEGGSLSQEQLLAIIAEGVRDEWE
jgi:galactofuranose transport system ATP-binding protein